MSSNARKYVASKYRYLGQLISGQRSKIFNSHALMIEKNSTNYQMMLIKRKNKNNGRNCVAPHGTIGATLFV